ncbi:hypothetical protein FA15DRAFT_556864, partial [Coprinopsis marcescibilis]
EEKKNKKAPTGKIMGDGLPHMLTSDEFLNRVQKHNDAQKQRELETEAKAQAKLDWQAAVKTWE